MKVFPSTLVGATAATLDDAIDRLSEREWVVIEDAYLRVAAAELDDWFSPMLGVADDVDVLILVSKLYAASLARDGGAQS